MKRLTLTLLYLIISFSLFAQSPQEQIEIQEKPLRFYQNGIELNNGELLEIMELNPEAYQLMRTAKARYITSTILGFTGGFLIGLQLPDIIRGDQPEWAFLGTGAGLIAVGIPLSISSKKRSKRAAELHNDSLNQPTNSWNFKLTPTGLGLQLHF